MNKIQLEFKDDKSSKFWKIEWNDSSYTVTYGKIGATGTSKTTDCNNAAAEARKQADSKIKKGYVEVATKPEVIVWDKEDTVSVWFTNFKDSIIPSGYLEFVYPDEDDDNYDDMSSSIFTREFDMDWYDEDFSEAYCLDEATNDYALFFEGHEYEDEILERLDELTSHLNGKKFTGVIILGATYCENIKAQSEDGTVVFAGALDFSLEGDFYDDASTCEEKIFKDGLTSVCSGAFRDNSNLKRVVLSDSIVEIESSAFRDCINLEEIVFSPNLKRIDSSAFSGCISLKEITIPNNVQVLGEYVFNKCLNLEKIILPDGLTTLGKYAFQFCGSLKEIVIPDGVSVIHTYTFNQCKNLEKIVFPKNLEVIEDVAFQRCESLKEIILPDSIKSIGEYAFNQCKMFDEITLPKNLEHLGSTAFQGCDELKEIIFNDKIKVINSFTFNKCKKLEKVVLSNSLTTISNASFQYCERLKEITLPDSLEVIEAYSFSQCLDLAIDLNLKSLKSLKKYSFASTQLKSVFIGEQLEDFEIESLWGCDNIKEFVVEKANKLYESKDGVLYSKGIKELLSYPTASENETFVLPEEAVLKYNSTFAKCKNLKKVTLNSNIPSILGWTFDECSNLEEVIIPNGVKTIEKSAFRRCESLKNLILPESVEELGDFCVCECTSLKHLNITKNVKEVGKNLLWDTTNLETITVDCENKYFVSIDNVIYDYDKTTIYAITPSLNVSTFVVPEGIKTIREGSIAHNNNIQRINLPSTLIEFEVNGIHLCKNVEYVDVCESNNNFKSVDGSLYSKDLKKYFFYPLASKQTECIIPNTVVSLESDCFLQAKNLTNIVIPNSVKEIKQFAFQACTSLKEIYIPDSVTFIGKKAFTQVSNDLIIYFNQSSKCNVDEEFNPLNCTIKSYVPKKEKVVVDLASLDSNEIYLEFIDEKSSKFWEVTYNDNSYTVTYGKIGTSGTSKTTNSENPKEDAKKQAAAKMKKGYVAATKEQPVDNKTILLFNELKKRGNNFVDIKIYDKEEIKIKDSKFGGIPFLPKGSTLPRTANDQTMMLLAQINLSKLPKGSFPIESGFLQFFIDGEDDLYGIDLDDGFNTDGFRVIYLEDSKNFYSEDEMEEIYDACTDESPIDGQVALKFKMKNMGITTSDSNFNDVVVELYNEIFKDNVVESASEISNDILDLINESEGSTGHRLLGYPFFTQSDPREFIEEDLILLFQIDTDSSDEVEINFGDSGVMNFFISKEDLNNNDFSKVFASWDCF